MTTSPQIPLPISDGDKSSFDNFWVGHNTELTSVLQSCVTTGAPKLIYIYGPEGSGKSHLLFAAMRLAKQEVSSGTFLSLADPNLENPEQAGVLLEMVDVAHLVCVDDLGAWAGDSERERLLFTLFEQIRHSGGELLVAGDRAPDKMGFELFDLVSRLGSGLIYPVQALSDEQCFEAIKLRAKVRGLRIDDEVVRYLLARSSREPSKLFELLDTIDQTSLIEKRRITIPFLQKFINPSAAG